jgi:hypothetical protein
MYHAVAYFASWIDVADPVICEWLKSVRKTCCLYASPARRQDGRQPRRKSHICQILARQLEEAPFLRLENLCRFFRFSSSSRASSAGCVRSRFDGFSNTIDLQIDPTAPRGFPQRGHGTFDHPVSTLGHVLDALQPQSPQHGIRTVKMMKETYDDLPRVQDRQRLL